MIKHGQNIQTILGCIWPSKIDLAHTSSTAEQLDMFVTAHACLPQLVFQE